MKLPRVIVAGAVVALALAGCSAAPHRAAPPQKAADPDAVAAADPDADPDAPAIAAVGGDPDAAAAKVDAAVPRTGTHGKESFKVTGHKVTLDLRTLSGAGPTTRTPSREAPRPRKVGTLPPGAVDPALQAAAPVLAAPTIGTGFNGLDFANWGAGWPPDTSGAVGPSQFVQTVNTSIGIWDKVSRTRIAAFTFDTFWGAAGPTASCAGRNGGDPFVLYDNTLQKWIITDFTVASPFQECIAVSSSPNLAGPNTWTLYSFTVSTTALADYPKGGMWSDAMYLTANMFTNGSTFAGPRVWAFQRSTLGGSVLNVQSVGIGTAFGSLLPANAYDIAAIPAGAPEPLLSLGASNLEYWEYKVDFANPANTTFTTSPTLLPVAAYTAAGTIRQPTGDRLDSLSDRLMFQLQYRNGSLWANHSVVSGRSIGIRWYEVKARTATTAPSIRQQATYAPDTTSRWMGTMGVDRQGDMLLGYSVASTSVFPGLRVNGRTAGAALNTFDVGEGTVVAGTGAQRGGFGRWGDYAQMSLDPNGCTLWFTSEYYTTTGSNWQTRIAPVSVPACVPLP